MFLKTAAKKLGVNYLRLWRLLGSGVITVGKVDGHYWLMAEHLAQLKFILANRKEHKKCS